MVNSHAVETKACPSVSEAKSSAQIYIPTLNGWRAVAITLVIGAHSITMLQNSGTKIGSFLAAYLSHAGYGVDVFFAISGYLICTLLLQEKAREGSISLGAFYIRRAFRILPPVIAYLTALGILKLSNALPEISTVELAAVAGFVRNYVSGSWYTAHFWSLAVEEHFYLVVPFIFFAFSWKASLRIAIAVVVSCAIIRWAEFALHLAEGKIEFRTESRIDAIMYGAIVALLLYKPQIRDWLTRNLTLARCAIGAILLIALLVLFSAAPMRRTLVAITMPVFIAYTVLRPSELIGRILEHQLVQWIGRLSYSLYIWHVLFLVPDYRPFPIAQSFPFAFALAFLLAVASYYFLEKPMIRRGHQIAARSLLSNRELPVDVKPNNYFSGS